MPSLEQFVTAYHRKLLALRSHTAIVAGVLWDGLGGPSDANLQAFVAEASPMAAGARLAAAELAAGYIAAAVGDVSVDIEGVLTEIRAGAPIAEVYARPVITMRSLLADGRDVAQALKAARARVVSTATTDVVLANRQAAVAAMDAAPRVVGYRRVLSGRSCAFCATASSQRYRTDQLMPLHGHCDCGIAPIIGDHDPGRVVNRGLLRKLKAEGGPGYWNGRYKVDADGTIVHADDTPLEVAVHEHGELGPTLGDARHEFTGPAGVPV